MINSEPRRLWGFTYTLDPEHDQKQAGLLDRGRDRINKLSFCSNALPQTFVFRHEYVNTFQPL